MPTLTAGLTPILPGTIVQNTTLVSGKPYQPTLLILGSLPSVRSLETQQYYGNPQNHFWLIIEQLFAIEHALPYAERCQALVDQGIILWDVIGSGERPGSLDADINRDTIVTNPIPALLAQYPSLQTIGCNGGSSFSTLKKHFPELLTNHRVTQLLSSSPANARYRPEEKTKQWRQSLFT